MVVFFSRHPDPNILPHFQVDRGAIKHIMAGSDIMCRGALDTCCSPLDLLVLICLCCSHCAGLTSPGGKMDDVPENTPVAIMAEGKEHALGIGYTKMSTKDM